MMKKFTGTIIALVLLTASTQVSAQNAGYRRPAAAYAGQNMGISGATIAAGLGIIVAIAAVALISNNSHSH